MAKRKKATPFVRPLPDKERWYRLEAVFEDGAIQKTPIAGAFFRGKLNGTVFVEVKKDFPQDQYGPLASWLEHHGIEAIIVKEGVRFLKLRPASREEHALLEEHLSKEAPDAALARD